MKAKTILLLAGGVFVFSLLRKKQQPGPGPGQAPVNPGGGILDDVLNIFSPGSTPPASNIISLWPTLAQFPVNEVIHINIPGLSAGVIVTPYSLTTYQPTYANWLQVPVLRQQMLNSINTWLQITGQVKRYK